LVILLPSLLTLIPIAALAAVLIMVGSRLGNPSHLIHAKKVGFDNLVGFAVTLILTLGVDLLVGIFVGALAQFLVEMSLGLKLTEAFKAKFKEAPVNNNTRFDVESSLVFSNFLGLKEKIVVLLDQGKKVKLDLTKSRYVDHTVIEQLHSMKTPHFDVSFSSAHQMVGTDPLSAKKLVS
jgi:MFS superfamily sulfate permease-like transporter